MTLNCIWSYCSNPGDLKNMDLVSLFISISTLVGYLTPKSSLKKNLSDITYVVAWGIRSSIPFQRLLIWKWMWSYDWSSNLLISWPQSNTLGIAARRHPLEYHFIAITPRSTLTQMGSTSWGQVFGQIISSNRLLRIIISSYSKPQNCVPIIL